MGLEFYIMLNAYWEPLDFELPAPTEPDRGPWRRWIDTGLESPQDIVPWEAAPGIFSDAYRADARSVVVLFNIGGNR